MFKKTSKNDDFQKYWTSIVKLFPSVVAREMQKESDKAFKNKSWDNDKWTKNKSKQTPSLIKSGRMKRSITTTTQRSQATISANTDYASYQQNGTSKIPARPFLGNSKQLEEFIENWLTEQINKRF